MINGSRNAALQKLQKADWVALGSELVQGLGFQVSRFRISPRFASSYSAVITAVLYARRRPERARRTGIFPFSSDQGCQTGLGSISTRLSDRPGTLSAVVSFVFKLACCVCIVCSVSCFMLASCICTVCSVSCLHACLLHLHIVQSTEN